jgi:hypothetical protein
MAETAETDMADNMLVEVERCRGEGIRDSSLVVYDASFRIGVRS